MVSNTNLFLAMSHEVCEEAAKQIVAELTRNDPFDDAALVLRSYGVDDQRIAAYRRHMRRIATERAHRIIAERFPEPVLLVGIPCPDCNGSGVAEYGYCDRCYQTGEVGLANYTKTHAVGDIGGWARLVRQ